MPLTFDELPPRLRSFETAFRDGVASCRAQCACGRVFYNPNGGWDWERGELETLKHEEATALDYAPGYVTFEGCTYVDACDCWVARATTIADWISGHDTRIAAYLTNEKKRKQAEADRAPVVGEEGAGR